MSEFTKTIHALTSAPGELTGSLILLEARARYIWLATALLNLGVPAYVVVVCGIIIYRSLSGRRLLLVAGVGLTLCAVGFGGLLHGMDTQNAIYRLIYGFTHLGLQQSGRFDTEFLANIDTVVSAINVLAVFGPLFIVLAAASAIASPLTSRQTDLNCLALQMRNLRTVLNAASALLVAGILHMNAWLQWPASLMSDHAMQAVVSGAALAIVVFWGTTFTLMLIATYAPAASALSRRANHLLAEAQQAGTISDPKRWLKEHNLSITLGEQLPQIGIMLAPVLAGPLGSLFMGTN